MTSAPLQKLKVPPVGVLAATMSIAASLTQELGIKNAVNIGKKSSVRGLHFSMLLVDDSAWPLTMAQYDELTPCLAREQGYLMHLTRHDPVTWSPDA